MMTSRVHTKRVFFLSVFIADRMSLHYVFCKRASQSYFLFSKKIKNCCCVSSLSSFSSGIINSELDVTTTLHLASGAYNGFKMPILSY